MLGIADGLITNSMIVSWIVVLTGAGCAYRQYKKGGKNIWVKRMNGQPWRLKKDNKLRVDDVYMFLESCDVTTRTDNGYTEIRRLADKIIRAVNGETGETIEIWNKKFNINTMKEFIGKNVSCNWWRPTNTDNKPKTHICYV